MDTHIVRKDRESLGVKMLLNRIHYIRLSIEYWNSIFKTKLN